MTLGNMLYRKKSSKSQKVHEFKHHQRRSSVPSPSPSSQLCVFCFSTPSLQHTSCIFWTLSHSFVALDLDPVSVTKPGCLMLFIFFPKRMITGCDKATERLLSGPSCVCKLPHWLTLTVEAYNLQSVFYCWRMETGLNETLAHEIWDARGMFR